LVRWPYKSLTHYKILIIDHFYHKITKFEGFSRGTTPAASFLSPRDLQRIQIFPRLNFSFSTVKMQALVDEAVLPGDVVGNIVGSSEAIRLGPGLTQNGEAIVATKAGILRYRGPDKYWIENSQKRVRLF
jgi:hypothetical protein